MKQWYEELFSNYAKTYDTEPFTRGTLQEVGFIESELGHDRNRTILDIGCGTGRHAIELALRGYQVTGIDISAGQLERAREKAGKAGVKVEFIEADARSFSLSKQFDAVIMICEGAFPLMETDEMNHHILENASVALKKGGKIILTTLNGLYPLFHSVKDFINSEDSNMKYTEYGFDLLTFREHSKFEVTDDSGKKKTISSNERFYVPPEITWLLKSSGFRKIAIFGCETGAFSREVPLTQNHFEMLVVAEK